MIYRGTATFLYIAADRGSSLPRLPHVYYPEAFYHSIQVGFNATDRFRFYVGVDNLTDVKPPYDLLGVEAGAPYDNIGRFFYAGFKANF